MIDFDELDLSPETAEDSVEVVTGTGWTIPGRPLTSGDSIIFDIETGPRPWSEIEQFYEPPEKLPPFDPASVKCGNLKDAAKIAEKAAKAKAEHDDLLAAEPAAAEKHKADWIGKAALSPLTGMVLAIGLQNGMDGANASLLTAENTGGSEAMLLRHWWSMVSLNASTGAQFIGFNIQFFDLPFLVRRSWALDVDVPDGVFKGRYFSSQFVDLMTLWSCGGGGMVSLDTLARYFGIGGKPEGVDGGMFAKLYGDPETRKAALDYLRNDLALTAGVARKMGVC
jgi:hypothetical protein